MAVVHGSGYIGGFDGVAKQTIQIFTPRFGMHLGMLKSTRHIRRHCSHRAYDSRHDHDIAVRSESSMLLLRPCISISRGRGASE